MIETVDIYSNLVAVVGLLLLLLLVNYSYVIQLCLCTEHGGFYLYYSYLWVLLLL
jgi:hypothetical protein